MSPNKFKDRTVIRFTSSMTPGVRHEIERNGGLIGRGEWVQDENTRDWLLVLPTNKKPCVLEQIREELFGFLHRDRDACINFLDRLEVLLQQISSATADNDNYSGSASINKDKIEIIFRHDTKGRELVLRFDLGYDVVLIFYTDEHDNRLDHALDMFQARGATAILMSALTA